jgi:hypothetical protein
LRFLPSNSEFVKLGDDDGDAQTGFGEDCTELSPIPLDCLWASMDDGSLPEGSGFLKK